MTLAELGWSDSFAQAFAPHAAAGHEPARIVCELRRKYYAAQTATDELLCECRGGFFHHARKPDQFPAIGDWVAIRRRPKEHRADIHAVLPRRTKFSRRAPGHDDLEQIIAANIDTVFLVSGLDQNLNPSRIQRFLVAARESGAAPVILLNKADLRPDAESVQREIETLIPGVPVHLTSAATRKGLKALAATYAQPGRTLAFIGSSGVGKSSVINRLLHDDTMPTAEVREKDSKGRHTTTRRELVITPAGALVIDTPGLRELQLWGISDGVEEAFAEIAALALGCRFTSCAHQKEPGCAVRAAIARGELTVARLDNYTKLKAEKIAATISTERKPGALADKAGWKNKLDHAKARKSTRYEED